jgi:hypothetical protein
MKKNVELTNQLQELKEAFVHNLNLISERDEHLGNLMDQIESLKIETNEKLKVIDDLNSEIQKYTKEIKLKDKVIKEINEKHFDDLETLKKVEQVLRNGPFNS